jgi:hypothetical protein
MATSSTSSPSTNHPSDRPETQLALRDPYYNILVRQVAGHLSTPEYGGLFQVYKGHLYPEYASRHYIEEIEALVVSTFAQRWAIFVNSTDFSLAMDTHYGHQY